MAKQEKINEKTTAAASYLITFYQEVNNLTHHYAQYSNLLIEAKNKYGKELDTLDDAAKAIIVTEVQSVRYCAYRCYIMYKTLIPNLKLKEKENLLDVYNKIKDTYFILQSDLEKFVIALNSVLVQEVIKDLLDTSQDLIENIYKNAETPTSD